MIRILAPGENVTDHPISEADIGTLTILETIARVDSQVDSLSSDIGQRNSEAKAHLSKSQKSQAMVALRSKKRLEQVLDKRLATVEQLRSVLTSIDTAKGDVEIMAAYETATSTLKGVLNNPLLDIARVEQTTDELAEVMADQAEVDSAIRMGGQLAVGGEVIDEDELQAELEGLVIEEKERHDAKEARDKKEAEDAEQAKKDQEAKERERHRLEEASRKSAQKPLGLPEPAASQKDETDEAWQRTYELAQQRKKEEAQRAAEERLRKEAQAA